MVGINATIKPYETNVLLNDIIPQGKTGEMFQQSWGGWTLDYDNTAYLMYHTGERWNPYDSDKELDALLESQRPMIDVDAREKVLEVRVVPFLNVLQQQTRVNGHRRRRSGRAAARRRTRRRRAKRRSC